MNSENAGGTVTLMGEGGMKYEIFTPAYRAEQKARVQILAEKIRARDEAIRNGKQMPDDGDIAIGTGRRLNVAILFLDIVGFSSRNNNSVGDQEANLRMMTYLFPELFRVVSDYGGTVEKNTGDGLMAYFEDGGGDPPAPGSLRAVSAAMTMKFVHRHLLEKAIQASGYPPVQFRISIDWGPVTIANVGLPRAFRSHVAIGASANLASKLQRFSGANEVVIGDMVRVFLPSEWQQWCKPIDEYSGWDVTLQDGTKKPYKAYRFTAEWSSNGYE